MSGGRSAKVLRAAAVLLLLAGAMQPGVESSPSATDMISQAIEQLDLALQQVVLAQLALRLEDLKFHAQLVLNVLEGKGGPHYNPDPAYKLGDGVGVINYVEQIRQTPEVREAEGEILVALANVSSHLEDAIAEALTALAQEDLKVAQEGMRQVLAFLSAAKGREVELTAAGGLLVLKARLSGSK
jgi:hypothetical protein